MKRGLLTRPLETYTEEEMGALLLLPGFVAAAEGPVSSLFSQFNEIGSLLQHVGGRSEVRNTDHGTLEIALHFPVPFTIMEAALMRTGAMRFALPAQQIGRFEAYRPERIERGEKAAQEGPSGSRPPARPADVLRFHFRSSRHHPVSNHQTHSDICAARSINCRSCGR